MMYEPRREKTCLRGLQPQRIIRGLKISDLGSKSNQRTNGPVNAHLIYWPSKAQNIKKTWKIYGKEMTLTFNTHIPS